MHGTDVYVHGKQRKTRTTRLIKYTSSMHLLGISMLLLRLQALSWLYIASILSMSTERRDLFSVPGNVGSEGSNLVIQR